MKINGTHYRSIWHEDGDDGVAYINQAVLPHRFEIARLESLADAVEAITRMQVRGAPLIGVAAVYGLALALREDGSDRSLAQACAALLATRPTAVNLRNFISRARAGLTQIAPADRHAAAIAIADTIAEEDIAICTAIAAHGLGIIAAACERKGGRPEINILTHCNAGWLATVDWGTALAPIYLAHDAGISLHVWVDETRPRNQGASLTALELGWHGVAHTVIADNAGGHLMQQGEVDLCIVGADRVAANGDTANKIGTYLKALAAQDNGVPFYVALPSTTIDWTMQDGLAGLEVEERSAQEVLTIAGLDDQGALTRVQLAPAGTTARNPAFDITPARLVTRFITEYGIHAPQDLAGAVPHP
jgi:methylthioribose-1-phosphate isomerase